MVMFALVMSEDRVSMQPRRQQIIQALKKLPGNADNVDKNLLCGENQVSSIFVTGPSVFLQI